MHNVAAGGCSVVVPACRKAMNWRLGRSIVFDRYQTLGCYLTFPNTVLGGYCARL